MKNDYRDDIRRAYQSLEKGRTSFSDQPRDIINLKKVVQKEMALAILNAANESKGDFGAFVEQLHCHMRGFIMGHDHYETPQRMEGTSNENRA